ncbi:MAG TPA: hypothetical protein VGI32_06370 [Steroidobacteraceae bacterium]
MRLRRPDQSERWRAAVFIAVLGLHVAAGLLLLASGRIRIGRVGAVESPLSLLWLPRESPPRPPISTASTPERDRTKREVPQNIERPPATTPEPSNAITLPLDLSVDADAAARRQSDKDGAERRWRNLAGPSESQLEWSRNNTPSVRGYHQLGDDERAAGGELITWVSDKCYYTTRGITTFGMPQTTKVCKDPPKPETDLFKDMRKQLDAGAKGSAP